MTLTAPITATNVPKAPEAVPNGPQAPAKAPTTLAKAPTTAALDLSDYVDEVSLTIPPDMTIDDAAALKDSLGRSRNRNRWWIGDLLWKAEARWAEQYTQLLDESDSTLSGYQWVASRIPPDLRDLTIPWRCYRQIARLPYEDQARLLTLYRNDNPSPDQWEAAVAEAKGETPTTRGRPKRDVDGAVRLSERQVGKVWDEESHNLLRDLLAA